MGDLRWRKGRRAASDARAGVALGHSYCSLRMCPSAPPLPSPHQDRHGSARNAVIETLLCNGCKTAYGMWLRMANKHARGQLEHIWASPPLLQSLGYRLSLELIRSCCGRGSRLRGGPRGQLAAAGAAA